MATGKINKTTAHINALLDEVLSFPSVYATNASVVKLGTTVNRQISEVKGALGNLDDTLATKADIDKSYPKMTAGFAQEIVGDGSTTPEEFSFRPTAGEDRNVANTTYYDGERNGVARIEKIKGNSVVVNNCIGNNIGQKGYFVTQYEDGSFLVKRNPEITSGVYFSDFFAQNTKFIDHKYAIIVHYVTYNIADGSYIGIYFYNITDKQYGPQIRQNGEGITTTIVTCDKTSTNRPAISYGPDGEEEILIKSRYAINLTKMFGAGNEPTTVEEFYQRLPVGIDLSQYNEGEIIDGNYGAIKTTGFNQWDEQWELGGITTAAGKLFDTNTRIRSKNYNPALPNTSYVLSMPTGQSILIFWYDSNYQFISYNYSSAQSASKISPLNARYFKILLYDTYGTTYNNDICINIAWNEYSFMNGTYQPYKPFTHDLSWVSKYFPNGMRSAGSVRDEIRFNPTTQKWEAVQNVGVRAYAEGDSEDTSVTTDGTNTNYALITPIVTEITEDINMDFDVSDYGTEELIVEEGVQSAPLVADITYAPNALSTLKQVPDILKRLKALESAVAQQTTNVEPSNIEE